MPLFNVKFTCPDAPPMKLTFKAKLRSEAIEKAKNHIWNILNLRNYICAEDGQKYIEPVKEEEKKKSKPKICGYNLAWVGYCQNPPISEECPRCEKHKNEKCCVCGAMAEGQCDHTGQFVCGYPLCKDCVGVCIRGDSGNWGFMNHRHARKADVTYDREGYATIAEKQKT